MASERQAGCGPLVSKARSSASDVVGQLSLELTWEAGRPQYFPSWSLNYFKCGIYTLPFPEIKPPPPPSEWLHRICCGTAVILSLGCTTFKVRPLHKEVRRSRIVMGWTNCLLSYDSSDSHRPTAAALGLNVGTCNITRFH
jgi:hypothetical protein